MIEFYLFTIVLLIALLMVLITYHNRRQSKALENVAESAERWLVFDIYRYREITEENIHIEDPYAWIEKYAFYSDLNLLRSFESIPALEFSCKNGTLVMSPKSPDQIRKELRRPLFSKPVPIAVKKSEVPLLTFNIFGKPKAEISSFDLFVNEFFDIEVEQVFEKLGTPLISPVSKLWFYFISEERK